MVSHGLFVFCGSFLLFLQNFWYLHWCSFAILFVTHTKLVSDNAIGAFHCDNRTLNPHTQA